MRSFRFRSRWLWVLTLFLLMLFPGSATADLLLPPLGYLGTNPWTYGYSTPPTFIDVKLNEPLSQNDNWPDGTWYNQWKTVPFDGTSVTAYVPGVVMGELGGASLASGSGWPYHGWTWHDEAVKAQSIAARTFGSFRAERRSEPGWMGIFGNSSDQVYRPFRTDISESTKQRYRDLSDMYNGMYLAYSSPPTQRHKVNLVEALYSRDVGNPSPSLWYPNPANSYPYLPSVANQHSTGVLYGVGGMPQLPLQGWTATGGGNVTFWQLLSHYYPNTTLMNKQPQWTVNYYYGRDTNGCTGSVIQTVTTKWINYDWDTGSLGILNDGRDPNSNIQPDNVCMTFTTSETFAGGWYTFYIVADDGFKLLIGGNEVLSRWFIQAPTMYAVNVPVTAGTHAITLRYFENTGQAVARLAWRRWNGMLGKYYDNVMPKGNEPPRDQIVMERFDPAIGFAWGTSSPLDTQEGSDSPYPKIHPDSFAVIWDSYLYVPPQSGCRTINFTAVTDDGMFVTVNGGTVLDQWRDQAPTTYNFSVCLPPGSHTLRAYYYESAGGATARLIWS